MNIESIQSVYFVGAGGIGMSALIRYFLARGKQVAGYDRTPSPLTKQLIAEGARLHYEENPNLIPDDCRRPDTTLVVYTPAVPADHAELEWFRQHGFEPHKRAQVLGPPTCSTSRTWAARPSWAASPRTTAPTCCCPPPVPIRSSRPTSSTARSIGSARG